jgi:hypothetical protein
MRSELITLIELDQNFIDHHQNRERAAMRPSLRYVRATLRRWAAHQFPRWRRQVPQPQPGRFDDVLQRSAASTAGSAVRVAGLSVPGGVR